MQRLEQHGLRVEKDMPPSCISDYAMPAVIEKVQALDPLSADHVCYALRAMNGQGDVGSLIGALRRLVPLSGAMSAYSTLDCLAAMRDLGMFLGSLKKLGVEPTEVVPEVVPVLQELGRRTDMVPRDTVHHYTTWNPRGDRLRMFTGDIQEVALQDSVRLVFCHLRDGLEL
jgi:hypothetical protein